MHPGNIWQCPERCSISSTTELGEIATYIPTNLISITDGQIYFEQRLFAAGFLPAIDVTKSVSRLGVLHHAEEDGEGVRLSIFAPFRHPEREAPIFSNPPLLNLPPANFLVEFADHYLLAALYAVLYRSLMVENRRRLQHMDNATHRLEQRMEELRRQRNRLRQEEITNEIEVIMLGQGILDPSSPATKTDYPQDGESP